MLNVRYQWLIHELKIYIQFKILFSLYLGLREKTFTPSASANERIKMLIH